ncbi:MAG: 4-alpha-glucanotransferase [Oscillospiraceae bacterium]
MYIIRVIGFKSIYNCEEIMRRSSGILLHITSLGSRYGIGTIGSDARSFADFLSLAKQTYWQTLPIGPTGYGDSPYQSFSTFAGNPYLIDLDTLVEDGLLTADEIDSVSWGETSARVDFGAVYRGRFSVLRKAFERGFVRDSCKISDFRLKNSEWVEDYSLFMALKNHFGMKSWLEWDDKSIRMREEDALFHYRRLLSSEIDFYVYLQYIFFCQWEAFRSYVNGLGIHLIGDLPIYVAADSSDVWSHPELFLLDDERRPKCVAGVPPDYFCADGQLWGNPIYDWAAMKSNGYQWWLERLKMSSKLFDAVRIDHFRGLESYWRVPVGSNNAINGEWVKGPGLAFVERLRSCLPELQIIAEDLGFLTDDVRLLVKNSGFPGMRVLQFDFNPDCPEKDAPHTYDENCVCYLGTHDNATALGWLDAADKGVASLAASYFGLNSAEGENWGMIRGGMNTRANLFVAQMQDYLGLHTDGRMNTPGTVGGNWCWRLKDGDLTEELAAKIAYYTRMFGRTGC